LAFVFKTPPQAPHRDRLSEEELLYLRTALAAENLYLSTAEDADERLGELRRMYEPYVNALSRYLYLPLPPWVSEANRADNWQTSAWQRVRSIQRGEGPLGISRGHFSI
jgi:hypothetical protein